MNGEKRRLERWATGEAHLDAMLRGGLPRGYMTMILGPTGSGKSVLAHQMSRLSGNRSLYVLTSGLPAEAVDTLFADPCPVYIDLAGALLDGDFDAVFERIEHTVDTAQAEMLLIDSLDPILSLCETELDRRRALRRLVSLAWEQNLCLVCFGRDAYDELLDAAVLVVELMNADTSHPRRLEVIKYVGSEYMPGEHTVRLGPLGLTFEAGSTSGGSASLSPVSGLGARILNTFRTAKAATPSELAILLGHDLDAIENAVEGLVSSGYLSVERDTDGQEPIFQLPRAT